MTKGMQLLRKMLTYISKRHPFHFTEIELPQKLA